MKHIVRPVWIALAGTTVPADLNERCRRSFEHIRRYFLENVGTTFQVAELEIVQTPCTAEHFKGYRSEYVPLLDKLSERAEAMGYGKYGPEWSDDHLFRCNLVAFIREELNADHNQAWVIFIPDTPKGRGVFPINPGGMQVEPGGYAIVPLAVHQGAFSEEVLHSITHELGHVFGLNHCACHSGFSSRYGDEGLEDCPHLMRRRAFRFPNCHLSKEEKEILLGSPFFTKEEL